MTAFGRRWHIEFGRGPWSRGLWPDYRPNQGGGHTFGWWQVHVWTTLAGWRP